MKKKSYIGWIEDGTFGYHIDTGTALKRDGIDITFKYFEYSPDVTPDRITLHIPLITPKKRFWLNAKHKSIKVKVTIEKVEKRRRKVK